MCQNCGSAHHQYTNSTQTTGSQQEKRPEPQQPSQVRRGIDLEETLRKYNEVRSQIFDGAEEKVSGKKTGEALEDVEQQQGVKEETALEKAWKQLRKDIEGA